MKSNLKGASTPHLLLLHTVGQLYYTLFFNHCVGAPKWFQQFQPGRAIGCHKKWSCKRGNEDHSEWLMWAKYKMCRAIKGGLLAELSILLRESFIKSSKRQGLCPDRTGRNTCCNRNGHSNNTRASRQEVCVCDNARAPFLDVTYVSAKKKKSVLYNTKQLFIWYARVAQSHGCSDEFWFLIRVTPKHSNRPALTYRICIYVYRTLYIMYVCTNIPTHTHTKTYVKYGRQIWANTTNKACEWTERAQPTIVAAFFCCRPQERWTKEQARTVRQADRGTEGQTVWLTDWQAHVNQRTET